MRLRSTLTVTAALALLAAAFTVPAQAMAEATSATRPAVAHIDSPTATAPTVVTAAAVKTANGIVIQATLGATDAGQKVSGIASAFDAGVPDTAVTGFTQTAPGSPVWQSPVLSLPAHGQYSVTLTPTDSTGTVAGQPFAVNVYYVISPVVHATITPVTVDYDHQMVTATGDLTTYDPGAGDTGQPYPISSNTISPTVYLKGPTLVSSSQPTPTGSFTVNLSAAHSAMVGGVYEVYAQTWDGTTTDPVTAPVNIGPLNATRIVLDQTSGTALALHPFAVDGTIEYQDASGVWHPLPGAPYMVGGPGYADGWNEVYQPTDADGRFTAHIYSPAKPDSFSVETNETDARWSSFLAPTPPATFTFTSITAVPTLSLSGSIDEYSMLSLGVNASTTNGHFPANRIYLLQSPDGHSQWKNLGYIPETRNSNQLVHAWVDNPHGYWKLWSPAAPGYAEAFSNVIHTFRYLTDLSGGKPSSTHPFRGQLLYFSGGLTEQGTGSWIHMGGGWRVYLFFQPAGHKKWVLVSYTRTDAHGNWRLTGRATETGNWEVAWFTSDSLHVDAFGPRTLVRVR